MDSSIRTPRKGLFEALLFRWHPPSSYVDDLIAFRLLDSGRPVTSVYY